MEFTEIGTFAASFRLSMASNTSSATAGPPTSSSQSQPATSSSATGLNNAPVITSSQAIISAAATTTSQANSNNQLAAQGATNTSGLGPPTISTSSSTTPSNISQPPVATTALDAFIANATTRPNNSLKHIAEYMRKTDDLLFNNLPNLDNALSLLNTKDNSLAIAQILWVKLSSVPCDADWPNAVEPTVAQTIAFFRDAHYSDFEAHGLDLFTRVCRAFVSLLVARQRPIIGIQPLRNVIKLLRKDGELLYMMTSFLYLCVKSKNFKAALEVLDNDIVEIRYEGPKSEVCDILLYFYYGGVCYGAMKNFHRSHLFFDIAISTPATSISKIMVEAYKKYILTSFILFGKLKGWSQKSSPSSNVFLKSVKSSTQAYSEILSCKSVTELKQLKTRHEALYIDDGNMGLVKQCIVSMTKRNIQKLTKTFLTLSIADITSTVKLESCHETESYLLQMIQESQINARIDHLQGMVYFLDNNIDYCGDSALRVLSEQISNCVAINSKFQQLDDSIRTSVSYLEKVHRMGSSGNDPTWDHPGAVL